MGINLGSTEISDLKIGETQVDKIYLGETALWEKTTPTADYTQLEYIETDGTAYIDVGSVLDNNSRPELKFAISAFPTDYLTYGVFGADNGTTQGSGEHEIGVKYTKNNVVPSFRATTSGTNLAYTYFSDNQFHILKFMNATSRPQYDSSYSVDGEEDADTMGYITGTWTISQGCYVFAFNNKGTKMNSVSGLQFAWVKIWNNSTSEAEHNFVACRRNSDSALGFYDTVTSTFYGNSASSGSFTAGPDVGPITGGSD